MPARDVVEVRGRKPTVADARGDSPFLLVWVDPESYLAPPAAGHLLETLERSPGAALVLPVSNEPWTEEVRHAPSFAYSTPSGLVEAARAGAASAASSFPVASPRSPVFEIGRAHV